MPYVTDFYGTLVTDKPIPEHIQAHIDFLTEIDTRALSNTSTVFPPAGFPVEQVEALADKGMYCCGLYCASDTEIKPIDSESPACGADWVQALLDIFLHPNAINATGRIQAAGEAGTSDLWCVVVGDNQVVHTYDGAVIYEDQPGFPIEPTGLAEPVRALGLRLLDSAAIAPTDSEAFERFVKAIEFSTIPEAAADIAGSFLPLEPHCDECDATTPPTFESAPGDFHDESCSLYTNDAPLGDVRVTPAAFGEVLRRVAEQDTPSS
jgi:hypothetical protein